MKYIFKKAAGSYLKSGYEASAPPAVIAVGGRGGGCRRPGSQRREDSVGRRCSLAICRWARLPPRRRGLAKLSPHRSLNRLQVGGDVKQ